QLCGVLQTAHDLRIIHRDLKPSNLMLADDDGSGIGDGEGEGAINLKVLDFGLAQVRNPDLDPNFTIPGRSVGFTLRYTSPEQLDEREVSERTDLFMVGLILYELLTGYHPFAPDEELPPSKYHYVRAITMDEAPRFHDRNPRVQVPRPIEELVLRCLEK